MEKFKLEILEYLIDKFALHRGEMSRVFDVASFKLKQAKSINEVMVIKRDLLVAILSCFPTMSDTCYFCEYHKDRQEETPPDCSNCSYGKFHGKCGGTLFGGDKENTWKRMNGMRLDLSNFIKHSYWTGGEMNAKHKRFKDI